MWDAIYYWFLSRCRVSNILKIINRKCSVYNTICCNQLLASNTSGYQSPTVLIGSTPVFNNTEAFRTANPANLPFNITILYQWQQKSRALGWTNITGANSKDYLPASILTAGVYNYYRRIVRFNYTILDYYFGAPPLC